MIAQVLVDEGKVAEHLRAVAAQPGSCLICLAGAGPVGIGNSEYQSTAGFQVMRRATSGRASSSTSSVALSPAPNLAIVAAKR